MGDFNVKAIQSEQDRVKFYHAILKDLQAFEYMLQNGIIEAASDTIGAEQEICIVDPAGRPAPAALGILGDIEDKRFTNELALYNLEVNLNPRKLSGNCFSDMAKELSTCLALGREVAGAKGSELLLTGNLPTLNFRHLMFDFMTPEDRYKLLSQELLNLRGSDFEIFLQGVDDFHTSLDSVLFEACNTSFQLHLQVDPAEFVFMHNWSQMISGPVLAACTNSPLLFGKELWAENRIALFKQSLDTRGRKNHTRIKLPRVYFGNDWIHKSALELWTKDVVRFPLLVCGYGDDHPMEAIKEDRIPHLKSVRLHNGTTYTWNRLCYGVANNSPHIRIECRYLPSGPSELDEIANFALWIGLMKGAPEDKREFWKTTDFRIAKSNFIKAARSGLQTVLHWFGKDYSAKSLLLEVMLPMARKGLERSGVDQADIDLYLSVIESRVQTEQTGSSWLRHNFRRLQKRYKSSVALRLLVQQSLANQKENLPVHEWKPIEVSPTVSSEGALAVSYELVEDIMNREVISVKENVSVEAIKQIMDWKGFRHLLVEEPTGTLSGLITKSSLEGQFHDPDFLAKEVMVKNVITISPEATLEEARNILATNQIGCLPVVEQGMIVGILTEKDLDELDAYQNKEFTTRTS